MNLGSKLQKYLDEAPGFSWESSNCCQFVCGWVQVMEGSDPILAFPSTHSRLAAYRLIQELGGLGQAFTQGLDREATPVGYLQMGDLVLGKFADNSQAVGIVLGFRSAFLTEHDGLIYIETLSCEMGWRVSKC